MQRKAEVISMEGKYAIIKSERSSMCDGCHKNTCGGTCAAGLIMGNDRSMTAKARNDANASAGDTVEIETSDGKVLLYALSVFILPIFVCAVVYGISVHFFESEKIPMILAAIGFVLAFLIVGVFEKIHNKSEPDIVITKVLKTADDLEN